ncbi:serine hydrolase domain-containing protein [Hymenobacter coalescens]
MRVPFTLCLLAGLLLAVFRPASAQQHKADSLTAVLEKRYRSSELPGFGVAIVTKDSVCYQRGFGFADVGQQRAYTPETIQNLGSVSKTVVGVALMKAVEQGLFTLDTPINELLPFAVVHPRYPAQPITVRHLATHTAGILDRPAVYRKSYRFQRGRAGQAVPPLADFLRSYFEPRGRYYRAGNFGTAAPGTAYAYSNLGTALAAYLIEVRTKQPFATYAQQHVFQPLQLRTAAWHYDAAQAPSRATNYKHRGRAYPPYSLITYPDGGLHLSGSDLARYLGEILKGYAGEPSALLRPASFRAMLGPQFSAERLPPGLPSRETNAGIFWVMRANGTIGHTGSDPGSTVFMFFSPATGIGKLLITNVDASTRTTAQMVAIWRALEAHEAAVAGR